MENIKCKNCKADLDPREAKEGVLKCNFCGAFWTLPKQDSAALAFLRQGEHELDVCRFDDAYRAFEKAAELDKREPEAYFGMALATFRVQYLKDELNDRLQPICHEISEKVFTEDKNYKKALELATLEQKKVYRRRGGEIDDIRDEFFALKESGLDYDCFLCVKVTAEDGSHTEDHNRANDIYYELKDKGYKPFYSEREMKGRTGSNYEALILYALYTSECMLIVCSNEEYLNTKWVKNEYTRFLAMVANEEKERDAMAVVFYKEPIERLPGRSGKLQGIDYSKSDATSRITEYVEKHTPEAKKKREVALRKKAEEEARKKAEEEERRKREEEERRLAFEKQQKEFEEQQRQILEEQRKELERLRAQSNAAQTGNLSGAALLEMLRKAQEDEARQKREEEERKRAEEEARRRAAETKFVCRYCLNINTGLDEKCRACGASAIDFIPLEQYRREQEIAKAKAEAERIAREKAEAERLAREKAEAERRAAEEAERRAAEEAERKRREIEQKPWLDPNYPTLDNYNKKDFGIKGTTLKKFKNKSFIGEVKIPRGVTSIGEKAFSGCSGLTEITVPEGVTLIEADAFQFCWGLKSINIPEGVTSIGEGVFWGCANLKSINIPEGVTSIGAHAFCSCKNMTNIIIPEGVTSIGKGAFSDCYHLTRIVIPESVTLIESDAFWFCGGLKSIVIPEGVTSIGESAFEKCASLTIYCLIKKRPSGWHVNWNKSNCPVVWGYKK